MTDVNAAVNTMTDTLTSSRLVCVEWLSQLGVRMLQLVLSILGDSSKLVEQAMAAVNTW